DLKEFYCINAKEMKYTKKMLMKKVRFRALQSTKRDGGRRQIDKDDDDDLKRVDDFKKTDHLLKLDGAKERLHLFKANLLEEGSFDAAVEGCEGVFHTASPFYHKVTDPQFNVLGINRVVVTSSVAAVAYNGRPTAPEVVVDETWYSDPDVCKENKTYGLTEAEPYGGNMKHGPYCFFLKEMRIVASGGIGCGCHLKVIADEEKAKAIAFDEMDKGI
ncbi:cinnamoyl-CoA reductase 1-like protein, partial [Tanacetum coccineum]